MPSLHSINTRAWYAIWGIVGLAAVAFVLFEVVTAVTDNGGKDDHVARVATTQVVQRIAADQVTLRQCHGIGLQPGMAGACLGAVAGISDWCTTIVAGRIGAGPVHWDKLDAACDDWDRAIRANDADSAGKAIASFQRRTAAVLK